MKRLNLILLIGALFLLENTKAQKTVYDANVEVRKVGSFTSVSVSSAIDLYISMGNEDLVAVGGADKSYANSITTEVRNGTLYIGFKGSVIINWGAKNMKAYVSLKTINKLEASGSSDVYVDGTLNATDLVIDLSGASDFKGSVQTENLRLNGSGSSDFKVSGKATNIKIDISGSSDVKGYELITDNCDIQASGSSDVQITVNKQLKVNATGASDISYKGEPTIKDVRTNGSSDIKKVGGDKTN